MGRGPEGKKSDDMIIFLPLILLFLVFGVLSGQTNIVFLLPTLLLLGAGAVFQEGSVGSESPHRPPAPPAAPGPEASPKQRTPEPNHPVSLMSDGT
jgi:hypothetical protein